MGFKRIDVDEVRVLLDVSSRASRKPIAWMVDTAIGS